MTDLNDLLHSFTLIDYHNEQLWKELHQIWGDNYWEKTPSFSVNCEIARSSTSLRNQSAQISIRESNQTGLERNRASVKSTGKSDVIRLTAPNSGTYQVLSSSVQEAAWATLKHATHLTKSVTRKKSRTINHQTSFGRVVSRNWPLLHKDDCFPPSTGSKKGQNYQPMVKQYGGLGVHKRRLLRLGEWSPEKWLA